MAAVQHILLVDDYEVNQIVARKHLESVGYKVDVAVDGSKAVNAFEQGRYDLILMDIEMPVLDGWESTKRIRSLESAAAEGGHTRVPIIAMSGHVLVDDTERYRQAGMDDCLAKPIERANLLEMVQKWLERPAAMNSVAGACKRIPDAEDRSGTNAAPIDLDKAIDEFMGDGAIVQQLLKDFVRRGSEQICTIEQALDLADYEQIRFEAHALKGGAANLTAYPLADSCAGVEAAAEAAGPQEIERLSPLFSALKNEFKRLTAFVNQSDDAVGSGG